MAKIGDLVLELVVDAKKGTATIKNFGKVLDQSQERVKQNANKMRSSFAKVAETGEKLFFTIKGYQALLGPLGNLTRAANDFENSNRKLEATSKLTGASLEELRRVSDLSKDSYSLNTIQANELTIALTKLGQKAGDTSQTATAIERLLDIAAAQGLNAEQALTAINQAILGIDEGTDKLFQKNPSVIYQEYANKIGTTAGKLDDQQKAQALLNAVMEDGLKVQGEYGNFLDSAAGKQSQATARAEELKASMGNMINLVWTPILEMATPVMEFFTSLDTGMQQMVIVVGLLTGAGWKLIPVFNAWNTSIKVLGISIKTALGWIGLIITAATLLYMAWNNNLFGIRDALNVAWEYIKGWTGIIIGVIKDWALNLANILKSVGDLFKNIFTLNWGEVKNSFDRLKGAFANAWDDITTGVIERYRRMQERLDRMDAERAKKQKDKSKELIKQNKQETTVVEDSNKKQADSRRDLHKVRMGAIRDENLAMRQQAALEKDMLLETVETEEEIARKRVKAAEKMWRKQMEDSAWFFSTLEVGYDEFFYTITDMEMSAKYRKEAIWNSMKNSFIGSLATMLKNFIITKTKEQFIHAAAEKTKTTVTQTQTAVRSGISINALIRESWQVMKNIGAYIGQIAAKLFSWFASLGPIGLLAGIATVGATVATIRALVKDFTHFARGGIATKQVLGMIGEAGDNEAVIPLNERGAEFMAQMLPKIVMPSQSADTTRLNRLESVINNLKSTIDNLQLRADIDSTEMAIVVEKGNKILRGITY